MTRNGNKATEETKSTKPQLAFVPRLMDLEASGHYLSLSAWSVRELVWAGKLPVVKVPRPDGAGEMRRVLIKREDLDAFIDGLEIDREVS